MQTPPQISPKILSSKWGFLIVHEDKTTAKKTKKKHVNYKLCMTFSYLLSVFLPPNDYDLFLDGREDWERISNFCMLHVVYEK